MRYGNRGRIRRMANSPLSVVVALIIFVFMAKSVWSMYDKVRLADARLAQAEGEIVRLENRRTDLATKVEYMGSERGLEAEIRTKYRAVKEGESVTVIIKDAANTGTDDQGTLLSQEDSKESLGWWRRALRVFGIGR